MHCASSSNPNKEVTQNSQNNDNDKKEESTQSNHIHKYTPEELEYLNKCIDENNEIFDFLENEHYIKEQEEYEKYWDNYTKCYWDDENDSWSPDEDDYKYYSWKNQDFDDLWF